eukprot:COSAG04_NODE_4872_length_1850_cov_23.377499_2_plen_92_part_00
MAPVYAGGTQKLRVLVGDQAAGFVMALPSATLVGIRAEIVEDELEVPEPTPPHRRGQFVARKLGSAPEISSSGGVQYEYVLRVARLACTAW